MASKKSTSARNWPSISVVASSTYSESDVEPESVRGREAVAAAVAIVQQLRGNNLRTQLVCRCGTNTATRWPYAAILSKTSTNVMATSVSHAISQGNLLR